MSGTARGKESTASTFVFQQMESGWPLVLIWHLRLECWMLPGGHVETFENAAEAPVREVEEETGRKARLVPGTSSELPGGAPHPLVPAPWWVQELDVNADNHTQWPHVHTDHLFLAVAEREAGGSLHEVRWFRGADVADHADIAADLRVQARHLFGLVSETAARLASAPAGVGLRPMAIGQPRPGWSNWRCSVCPNVFQRPGSRRPPAGGRVGVITAAHRWARKMS